MPHEAAEFEDAPVFRREPLMDTDTAWELWGARDPYFSVLTHPKFRSEAITPEAKQEFFDLGSLHVDYVLGMCRQTAGASFAPQRILDFGCGVGRVLVPFARTAREVVGVDISPSMLAEARRNCDERGAPDVLLVGSDDMLSAVEGKFDLVHSCIVLQHIEIARGRQLFALLVDKVAPGGCGAIQVTFGWDMHAVTFGAPPQSAPPPAPSPISQAKGKVRALLRPGGLQKRGEGVDEEAAPADPEMQMNFYNFSELMFILQRAGVQRFHTEFTDHGGALGAFLFFQKTT